MKPLNLTIVICTYNRSDILELALESISNKLENYSDYELLIIDNNSSDNTREVVEGQSLVQKQYIFEARQGLSFSRNTGSRLAKYDWILYLDDDIQLEEDIFSRALVLSSMPQVSIVGGLYTPWYYYEKPAWYRDAYSSNEKRYASLVALPKGEYISGGIMLVRKIVLEESKGFRSDLGMKGEAIGYGEETELQMRLRDKGFDIYYDPKFEIKHIVQKYKYSPYWHVKSGFIVGRTNAKSGLFDRWESFALIQLILMLGQLFIYLIRNTIKLISTREFYFENFVIETFRKPSKRLGAALYYLGFGRE